MTTPPPPFVSVDGIDGVGKSTQIERLSSYLKAAGYPGIVTRDPGSTEIGGRLRQILLEGDLKIHRRTEAMLFMASRCEMIETIIAPALHSGQSVISDRFLLATVVYQSTVLSGEGVSPELLWKMGQLANNGMRPDLTILLDMPASESMKRIHGPTDRMESRGVDYMESVRQAFLAQLPQASDQTVVINAAQSPDQVTSDINDAVKAFLDTL